MSDRSGSHDGDMNHVMLSGGSRGLGRAIAESLLGDRWRVSVFSRRPTEFTKSLESNASFFFQPADASDVPSLSEFVKAAESRFGTPTALINCAGVAEEGVIAAIRPDQIERVLSVNLAGPLHLTRLVSRRMLISGAGGGSIINISSIVGLRGYRGLSAYGATKGGLDAMTRSLARELGDRNIRVNSIAPGYLETEMTHGLTDEHRDQIVRRTPLARLGRPEDVTGAVRFLLSEDARFITGQVIVVDGGVTC